MDDRLRLVRHELIRRRICAGAILKPVIVHHDHAPTNQPLIKESQAIQGRLVKIYIDVNELEPFVRDLMKSFRIQPFMT